MDRYTSEWQPPGGPSPKQDVADQREPYESFSWFGVPSAEPHHADHTEPVYTGVEERLGQQSGHEITEAGPGHERTERKPAYDIPAVPETGWSADQSCRRTWIGRALLLGVLVIQAVLSLRLHNTAFQDEALYLFAGRHEISHLLHGTAITIDYSTYFSGSPWLYPVLGGAVNMLFGLAGARLLSLFFMLSSTGLLYSLTRRLFNERVGISAAALYAVLQSTVTLGFFATYDPPAVFLISLSAWIIVRTDRASVAMVLWAAPVAALSVVVKYASGLYLPTMAVLAVLVTWRYRGGKRAVLRGLLLMFGIGVLLFAALVDGHVFSGVQKTTTARAHGRDSILFILNESLQWGGLMFAVACAGAVAYVWRERMNEVPTVQVVRSTRKWRAALAVLLCGTAVLAPGYQAYLHTSVSLYKHIGFGLFFAAPLAGVGITRLVGAHFRQPQLGILVWVVMLASGISQSAWRFGTWPDSTQLVQALRQHVNTKDRYLAETYEVPMYYVGNPASSDQWTSTYFIDYHDAHGVGHQGADGYRKAIKNGYFNLIILDGITTPAMDKVITAAVADSGRYQLINQLPFVTSSGTGAYQIYQRR